MRKLVFAFLALFLLIGPAFARTIDVYDDHGGSVAQYDARWSALATEHPFVRIVGPCQSACTVLLGHIPRSRICVTPAARFGFHLAGLPSPTATLWGAYPGDVRAWIQSQGGLSHDFKWMTAPETYRHFRRC